MDDSRAWARWWRLVGFAEMRGLLWEHWDPLALRDQPDWPQDEYDGYAPVIASKLRQGVGRDDLTAYLATALQDRDEPITPEWQAHCASAADVLISWFAHVGKPG